MGKKKGINRQTLDLPDELIWESLIKFPVKSLLRFKCVSKSWCSIISSKEFIRAHLKNWSASTDLARHKVILSCYNTNINKSSRTCSLKSVVDESGEGLVVENLDHHPIRNWIPLNMFVRTLGSCDGLVLLDLLVNWNTFLWNPSTREANKIPCPPFVTEHDYSWEHLRYGFGYDDETDDYKVVCISSSQRPFQTQIYSCRTNSWREIENFPKVLSHEDSGQLVNGKLHWLADEGGRWDIVSLSLVDEKYEVLPWPETILHSYSSRGTLGNLGGYLSFFTDDSVGGMYVWIMKKYGEVESWTKILTLSDFLITLVHRNARPLWLSKNGDIALAVSAPSRSIVAVYDIENKVCKSRVDIADSQMLFEPSIYVESLVSPFRDKQLRQ